MYTAAQASSPGYARKHWAPFTTRTPWLMIICLAVMGCVAAIELALRVEIESVSSTNLSSRLVRRQDDTSTTDNGIERISINEGLTETSNTYAESDDFLTLTTISDEASTTSTYTPPQITGTSAMPEDFLTLTTLTPGATPSTISGALPPTTSGSATPTTSRSVLSRITVANTDAGTPQSTLEVVATIITVTSDGTTALISTATTIPALPDATAATVKSSQVQLTESFGKLHYFLATYLSVLIIVVLKITWALTFSGMKMMEPFHQLSKPGGATAKESLTADFLSSSYGLSHLRHIFRGHWAMLFSTMTCIAIGVLSPISSEMMTIVATQVCPTSTGRMQACAPVWVINTPTARFVEVVLIFTALLISLSIIFNFHRKSGVFSDPSSIATMASLLSNNSIQQDLRSIDQSSSNKDALALLEGNRYMITSAIDPRTEQYRYGLINARALQNIAQPYAENHGLLPNKEQYKVAYTNYNASFPTTDATSEKGFPQWKRMLRDLSFLVLILGLFGTVLAYYLIGGSNPFNNFFNSKTFGPRFLLTTAASIINFAWCTLEREVRIMSPYLAVGKNLDGTTANESIRLTVGGYNPASSLFYSLRRRSFFHAAVALTALLSDILIVAVGGVPLADAQIQDAFRYVSWISMGILVWMVGVMGGVFWWRVQVGKLRMPREPDCVLAVALMLVDEGNGVVEEFRDGVVGEREKERERGRKYVGGWRRGEDGGTRWCVGVKEEGYGFSSSFER